MHAQKVKRYTKKNWYECIVGHHKTSYKLERFLTISKPEELRLSPANATEKPSNNFVVLTHIPHIVR